MEENTKNPVERFLERTDLNEVEASIASRIANGRQQLDEASAALQRLRDEGLRLEQRLVGLSHQVKAMADLAAEMQVRHETQVVQTNEVHASAGEKGVG